MESPAPAPGPCVYVPISHPDSPVPTYAVVQVLGISPAPAPTLHARSAPSSMRPTSSPASTPPSPAPKRCVSSAESTNSSSSSDERDRHLPSIKPAPMKKSASGSGLASPGLSPAARRSGKILPFRPTISVTHTGKDTVIHAEPCNFRKVVHELTGATSGEKGLRLITLPTKGTTVCYDREPALPESAAQGTALPSMARENGGGSDSADVRKPAAAANRTANLLERRKSNKVLARLQTSGTKCPPHAPSPVTPLASDFEKISLPVTPSSSEGSLTPGRFGSVPIPSPLSHGSKAMGTLSLSGGVASHTNGCALNLLQARSVRIASPEVKLLSTDAMDIEQPAMSQLLRSESLRLCSREDAQLASSHQMENTKASNLRAESHEDGLSLALAPATGAMSRLSTTDLENEDEPKPCEDAMDTEIPNNGVVVHNSSSIASEPCSVDGEGSIPAKKGFFFQIKRPRCGDPTLLALFPESSREL